MKIQISFHVANLLGKNETVIRNESKNLEHRLALLLVICCC